MNSFTTFILLLASIHHATPAAIYDLFSPNLVGRDKCTNPTLGGDNSCYSFCNPVQSQINGQPIQASDEISCDTSTCSDSHANSVTVTAGFTLTAGFSQEKGPLQASATFTFSQSLSTTNTYNFNLVNGDSGHIEFTPKLNQICGTLKKYVFIQGPADYCASTVSDTDPNACATSGIKLSDGTADGIFSFCNSNGTGCSPFSTVSNSKKMVLGQH